MPPRRIRGSWRSFFVWKKVVRSGRRWWPMDGWLCNTRRARIGGGSFRGRRCTFRTNLLSERWRSRRTKAVHTRERGCLSKGRYAIEDLHRTPCQRKRKQPLKLAMSDRTTSVGSGLNRKTVLKAWARRPTPGASLPSIQRAIPKLCGIPGPIRTSGAFRRIFMNTKPWSTRGRCPGGIFPGEIREKRFDLRAFGSIKSSNHSRLNIVS